MVNASIFQETKISHQSELFNQVKIDIYLFFILCTNYFSKISIDFYVKINQNVICLRRQGTQIYQQRRRIRSSPIFSSTKAICPIQNGTKSVECKYFHSSFFLHNIQYWLSSNTVSSCRMRNVSINF